jgi:hypothetical protein
VIRFATRRLAGLDLIAWTDQDLYELFYDAVRRPLEVADTVFSEMIMIQRVQQ